MTAPDIDHFALQFLHFASDEERVICLHSNEYEQDPYSAVETLLAMGTEAVFDLTHGAGEMAALQSFLDVYKSDWVFGHVNYEALSLIEPVETRLPEIISTPLISFFVPRIVIEIAQGSLIVHKSDRPEPELLSAIHSLEILAGTNASRPILRNKITQEKYLEAILELQQQIKAGNFYEINFCHFIQMEQVEIEPIELFHRLNKSSRAPYSAYYRWGATHLCCASPERFMARREDKLICQPIKGTNRRLKDDQENEKQQSLLYDSEKERAENVMIVDLIRNDLSRVCQPGSVKVEELFGIYAFTHVNQMISTISGQLRAQMNFTDVLQALFPPGSMTGAPKVSAMQWIERTESFSRGLYSGTVGYIRPGGDWDFNIIIRAIQLDTAQRTASLAAGGAITFLSEPQAEYEESLLKMESLLQVLQAEE